MIAGGLEFEFHHILYSQIDIISCIFKKNLSYYKTSFNLVFIPDYRISNQIIPYLNSPAKPWSKKWLDWIIFSSMFRTSTSLRFFEEFPIMFIIVSSLCKLPLILMLSKGTSTSSKCSIVNDFNGNWGLKASFFAFPKCFGIVAVCRGTPVNDSG